MTDSEATPTARPARLADTPAVVRARKAQEEAKRKHHQAVTAAEAARRTVVRLRDDEQTADVVAKSALRRLRQEMAVALAQDTEKAWVLEWFRGLSWDRDSRCLFCAAGGVRRREKYIGGKGYVTDIECDRCPFRLHNEFADPAYWIAELAQKGETA